MKIKREFMTHLDKVRAVVAARKQLYKLQHSIIEEAVKAGLCWKELAFIDKIEAIRLCRSQEGLTLHESKDKVETFLEEAGRK